MCSFWLFCHNSVWVYLYIYILSYILFGMPQGLLFNFIFSISLLVFNVCGIGGYFLIPVLAFLITNLCSVLVCILAEVKGPSSQNWWTVAILYCLSATEERSVVELTMMQNRCSMLRSLFDKHLFPSFWKTAQLCLLNQCVGIYRKKWER